MVTSKHAGLESFDVSLEKQTVIVHPTTATYEEVLEKIKKTGKEVCVMPIYKYHPGSCLTSDRQVRSGKTVDGKTDEEPSAAAAEPSAIDPPAV